MRIKKTIGIAALSILTGGCATMNDTASRTPLSCPANVSHPAEAKTRELFDAGLSGAVVITRDGEPVYCGAAGEAFANRPFDVHIPVDVGSVAKPVTALAIHTLALRHKLRLDDPLNRWFPTVPADKAGITVRQLLLHTSGLGEYVEDAEDYTRLDQEELVRRVFAQPLVSAPGAQFAYSNSAYNLLAVIVARASGRPYVEYVDETVFQPAGIRASFDPAAFPAVAEGRSASGWTQLRSSAAAANGPFWALWGAGGLFMSASEMAQLMDAFAAGRILPIETVRELRVPAVPLDARNAGGLAWGLVKEQDGWGYYFNGASDHSSADIRHDPDTGVTIAVVSNSEKAGAIRAGRLIAAAEGAQRAR